MVWSEDVEDAIYGVSSGWSYQTDIPAPPPTDLPEDQHDGWIWAEYDLRKKHDGGNGFEDLMAEMQSKKVTI